MRDTSIICDRCNGRYPDEYTAVITGVEITYGGNGAVKDIINNIDLCRSCYGYVVGQIKYALKSPMMSQKG